MSSTEALRVTSLNKTYGATLALSDVSFAIPRGQACAVIGPNGAGKTTLVEIMVNLRRADSGTVHINGINPVEDPRIITRIGVQLQEARLFTTVTVARYLDLFSKLYGVPPASEKLIADLGLTEHLKKAYSDLSGGLKQRLLLALSLLNNPDILILDEPTAGLDPIAREELWDFITGWRNERRTLLLTSHLMDEVERQCDRVIVLSDHRIVADGSVDSLLDGMPSSVKNLHEAFGILVGRGQ
ncbi:MAG: ABC transporter ATP-binding protein [Vulcanimicrobiaceae bacterium]